MNTPETINIEKYAEALNNLIGVDSAYMAGDKDVDAIVEVIVAAKKLENRVKELKAENERLNKLLEHCEDDGEYWEGKYNNAVNDTIQRMQERLEEKIDRTLNVFDFQISECDAVRQALRGVKNDTWVITENGCVITCPNCGERLELCYPDGTEVRYLPHCPWCGKKLEK